MFNIPNPAPRPAPGSLAAQGRPRVQKAAQKQAVKAQKQAVGAPAGPRASVGRGASSTPSVGGRFARAAQNKAIQTQKAAMGNKGSLSRLAGAQKQAAMAKGGVVKKAKGKK